MPQAKKKTSKKATKKAATKKTAAKKTAAKKKAVKKKAAKKTVAKKTSAAKKVTKKTAVKKTVTTVAKKTTKKVVKKTPKKTAKPAAKKLSAKTSTNRNTTASMTKPSRKVSTAAFAPMPLNPDSMLVKGFKPYQLKSGEEYMSPEQIEHFRKLLNAWKKELMEEVERTVHHMQNEAANFPDQTDRASQESEFSLELRARDRERKLIKKINESLSIVDGGDYGYCEGCDVEIGIRRLEARPTANLCIDCKELDEIKEKQFG